MGLYDYMFGGDQEAEVEVAAAVPAAAAMAAVALDAQELDENLDALGEMAAGDEEVDMAANLRELLEEVRQGKKDNAKEFEEMRARLEVLEANTFVEAAKWIYEAICELFCKMEKAIVDFGENFPLIGDKANRAREFSDLKKDFDKDIEDIDKLAAKSRLEGRDDKEHYEALKEGTKLTFEEKQEALHVKHEKFVDAKYGKGRYEAEHPKDDNGKFTHEAQVLTAGEKTAFWEKDANCQYNKIDVAQQMHVAQGKVHGDLLAQKWPEVVKAGKFVGRQMDKAGQQMDKAGKAVSSKFREMVAKDKGAAQGAAQGRA